MSDQYCKYISSCVLPTSLTVHVGGDDGDTGVDAAVVSAVKAVVAVVSVVVRVDVV